MWLKRVTDKARASAAGTIHDYIYPCPMDQGVFERWGITAAQFEKALGEYATDESIHDWLKARVPDEAREAANSWLVNDKAENLDRQDREETPAV